VDFISLDTIEFWVVRGTAPAGYFHEHFSKACLCGDCDEFNVNDAELRLAFVHPDLDRAGAPR
jgi:hypothetical protein